MKRKRANKSRDVGIVEQILDDEYGIGVEGYNNKQLKSIGAMMTYLGKNREEPLE